jgi:hypothetical protein
MNLINYLGQLKAVRTKFAEYYGMEKVSSLSKVSVEAQLGFFLKFLSTHNLIVNVYPKHYDILITETTDYPEAAKEFLFTIHDGDWYVAHLEKHNQPDLISAYNYAIQETLTWLNIKYS